MRPVRRYVPRYAPGLGKMSVRQLRLFACGWCRLRWEMLDEQSKRAVEVAERFADGLATAEQLKAARSDLKYHSPGDWKAGMAAGAASETIRTEIARGAATWDTEAPSFEEDLHLILEITGGNCHRDVPPSVLKWNCDCVEKVATAIYHERAFDRMPVLADALEDAGCDNAHILKHCRHLGGHVRGCWVIDLLLGKS